MPRLGEALISLDQTRRTTSRQILMGESKRERGRFRLLPQSPEGLCRWLESLTVYLPTRDGPYVSTDYPGPGPPTRPVSESGEEGRR